MALSHRCRCIFLSLIATAIVASSSAAQPGRVIGQVTEAGLGTPIAGAQVALLDAETPVLVVTTGADGTYDTAFGLPPATYTAIALAAGFACEVFAEIFWSCSGVLPAGDPIVVAPGSTVAGIDFTLALGGNVAGAILDAASATPIAGVEVLVTGPQGVMATGTTNSFGQYVAQPRLAPGPYNVHTSNVGGYVDEVYDDIPCVPICDPGAGDVVDVAAQSQSTANFLLAEGGRFAGQVTAYGTGAPLATAFFAVWSSSSNIVDSGGVGPDGTFRSRALPAGTYYAVASAPGFESQLFDGLPCLGSCNATTGTPIVVAAGETEVGIDFALLQRVQRSGFESGAFGFWSGGAGATFCAHDVCTEGGPLDAACDPCVDAVCNSTPHPECCDTLWDEFCMAELSGNCNEDCS